jgi:ATP-dependent DNA ligase
MQLPVMPPVKPMLAKSVPEIPTGDLSFEPKWDGFRAIVFRDGDEVEIGSRNEKPMTRYFPEVVEAVKANLPSSTARSSWWWATGSSSRCFSSASTRRPAG